MRSGTEHRVRLQQYWDGVWWDEVEGMSPGTHYGIRAHGRWDPSAGFWYNPHKLLVDPYTRGVSHVSTLLASMFSTPVDSMLRPSSWDPDPVDNGDHMVHSVVVSNTFDWNGDAPVRIPWRDTVIYELHVRGFTRQLQALPAALRGTYAGLGHEAVTSYLRDLGVTTVELLPMHAMMDEAHLVRCGLTNYWGYNTLGFFAPNPQYATQAAQRGGAQAVVHEFKTMVASLHAAGIEVVLDVVYNHTAEAGAQGPTLSLRGLDTLEYYRVNGGNFDDVTGVGNTVNVQSHHVRRLILDSLRYWVEQCHIDGFRFDLATALGRGERDFRPDHPLLAAIQTDPVLSQVKLIAEPWDIGWDGWQTGRFPTPFAQWNDHFRDDTRTFWLERPAARQRGEDDGFGGVRDLATRLAGSADLFTCGDPAGLPSGRHMRTPYASVNFVTAHDGFTLYDLTAYERKHNEANGEDNRDGSSSNRSYNHGVEGEPSDLSDEVRHDLMRRRSRSARNLMATLLLSAGTPMLTAGDEVLRTQRGNNNAYCLDNETTWVAWDHTELQKDFRATVRELLAIRRRYPQLRPETFLRDARNGSDGPRSVAWFDERGDRMSHESWADPRRNTLIALLPGMPLPISTVSAPRVDRDGFAEIPYRSLLLIMHGGHEPCRVILPPAPWTDSVARVVFASEPTGQLTNGRIIESAIDMPGPSIVVLELPGT